MKRTSGGFPLVAMLTGSACVAGSAMAQQPDSPQQSRARSFDNPYTVAEVGLGVLTLPTSKVCLTSPDTCTRGDTNPYGYAWMLYRASALYAIGAGASYAPPVKSDTPPQSYSDVDTSHTRQYLLIDIIGRYYALRLPTVEGWLGMTGGGVAVSDRYTTDSPKPTGPILGPSGVTVRTEGLSAGIAAGLGYRFATDWSVEGSFRTAWWFLPGSKACAPTGDCATLSSDVAMFSLAISVGYRIPL